MDIKDFTGASSPNPFSSHSAEEILEFLTETKEQLQNAQKAAIVPALEAVFREHGALCDFIVVRGSTPSFNDGDPCVHNQNVIWITSELDIYAKHCDIFEGADLATLKKSEPDYFGRYRYSFDKVREFLDQKRPGYFEALKSIEKVLARLEDCLYAEYGTDWELHIAWDGTQISLARKDYYEDY